jgi:hypothetical protein
MRYSQLSRRLHRIDRGGPGEVTNVEGPCAERRDCRSLKLAERLFRESSANCTI